MKKLLAVVGMAGTGKSIATDYLEEKGWHKIYFGGVVLKKLQESNLEITPENEKMMREGLRKQYGMAAMAKILLPEIEKSLKTNDTVLDGLYSWEEYLVLKEKFQDKLQLLCVITDKKIRYQRVSKRAIRPFNREEIEKRDFSEIENLNKGGPIAMADYFLLNNGTLENYYERLEEILSSIDSKGDK